MTGVNLAYGLWERERANTICQVSGAGVRFVNPTGEEAFFRLRLDDLPIGSQGRLEVEGELSRGVAGVVYVVDRFNRILGQAPLSATAYFEISDERPCALLAKVPPASEMRVSSIVAGGVSDRGSILESVCNRLSGRIAVVVPSYPSSESLYPCAFVHARVRAYIEAGLKCEVIVAANHAGFSLYEIDGVRVVRTDMRGLGLVLERMRFDAVALHFFDPSFASVLDRFLPAGTPLILWSHNPETRYWDWPLFTARYFQPVAELSDEMRREFSKRDEILARYNRNDDVTWVFVSDALKARSEELVGFPFNRAHVIPNLVDERVFAYRERVAGRARRIVCVRKFEDVASYALDIVAQVIVELSKRSVFEDLEFDVYGAGPLFSKLTEPIEGFANVRLHRRFLSRAELAETFSEHDIALFPTRFDSQGVAMGEAAMSGLAVVSSDIPAARNFLPVDRGLLCDVEDPVRYADAIERLHRDEGHFAACSRACRERVYETCRRAMTVDCEIELIRSLAS